ncbi:pyridoxamine 5'-phosphate oxidase [Rhodospirillum rubrum]|uniref:Pyridoxine/pyridoxamine 5'-phosphate oxidase n=1 Tax=Rhodospirillum rubrum (strain ATCC 11170 / ATH 1.1.1 / DSM 467 / LMG 4362 / NCIMB 8255 / S1) TaxID=269796 RepID=PDXH_RHORT|nr:pyridoxamine 5'-phosphate oxidase [Rhodospirillum rubrum]Q2RR21.1 RecName: Full=Pyridoxine/pyridoxamine 5'-phosphate oxidase; AltName: Full=PNP/PMP oxidase; Short=PNPOx; AltName: Full=Pyridoxal 5'-phosphate synthase [Rhodospirillum rubrum ATCC 11170]ABC23424.1 Pyridoxamine 5'-phosphate oxidase [Rhodospirillum rubrum ATCC 11170]AEO49162.1 pyridoxamine 5'-phosphate oxidase [Rhodospirillum rubrum F11]MBK5955094.1 pyridoxine/pyridoxamine 5'-phosphate oxidase [Rhodospirillum rubrum]QXG79395.1 py
MSSLEDRDPYALFAEWLEEAGTTEPNDPNAMALATCTPEGRPSLRMVLLKGVIAQADAEGGFIFYTNLESRKGGELLANPHAALCFHWKSLRRQVRVEGPVVAVSDAEADAYFASRHRDSRIGAWASMQSRPLQGRFELERRVAQFAARYAVGAVPRPPHWSGFRVVPEVIEFWHDRPFRLHDRVVYRSEGSGWTHSRLYP